MYLLVGNKTEYIIYTYTCEAFLVYCTQGKNTKKYVQGFCLCCTQNENTKALEGLLSVFSKVCFGQATDAVTGVNNIVTIILFLFFFFIFD